MKHVYKNKRAFTLIELLIVITIIGILFIVLVSRVDFATDKAKSTGVQTDFRSFQVALETVSKENAGFASLGWNTGDDNGDRVRNSYDEGDIGFGVGTPGYHNGKVDSGEIWTGHKVYGETWGSVYTLVNPADNTDTSAFQALEAAINANLDPKLHITITPELSGTALTGNAVVSMANGAQDPWKKEYHGVYITNAVADNGADRGAFVLYSDGANGKNGSEHSIANGVVTVVVPGNNIAGKDDYALVNCYTYTNGYGETKTGTFGFSSNQEFLAGNNIVKEEDSNTTSNQIVIVDNKQLLEFTMGTFESITEYTPGEYQVIEYETTKLREKKPVAYDFEFIFTGGPDDYLMEPSEASHKSTYIAYLSTRGNSAQGVMPALHYKSILNIADDTLENAIYLAAYTQRGTGFKWKVAQWDGTKYVEVDCRDAIDAIIDFTEFYTDIEHKSVVVSAPSSNTDYVYIPNKTMQAELGMTWAEWIASSYNTIGATKIWDANYNEIPLTTLVSGGKKYGFGISSNETISAYPIQWNTFEVMSNINNGWTDEHVFENRHVKVSEYVPTYEELSKSQIIVYNPADHNEYRIYSLHDLYDQDMLDSPVPIVAGTFRWASGLKYSDISFLCIFPEAMEFIEEQGGGAQVDGYPQVGFYVTDYGYWGDNMDCVLDFVSP